MLRRIAFTAAAAAILVSLAVLAAWRLDAALLAGPGTPAWWGTVAGAWLMAIGGIELVRSRASAHGGRRGRSLQLPPLRRR